MSGAASDAASLLAAESGVINRSAVLQLSYEEGRAAVGTTISPEERARCDSIIAAQGECGVRDFFLKKYETESVKNWDRFYKRNADRFYKDRHYLTNEFKELRDVLHADRRARGEAEEEEADEGEAAEDEPDDSPAAAATSNGVSSPPVPLMPISEPTSVCGASQRRLLEVGCGVGNALFPLLRRHQDVFFYGIDCSRNAIQVVQNHADYSSSGRCAAWVTDLATEELPAVLREGHIDFATLIFVLSAIHPDKMHVVLEKVHRALKKDEGVLFIRDYGEYDLAQLRFAKTSKLGSSWYVRSDGTRSYFFTLPRLCAMLTAAGFDILDASCVKKTVINRKEQSEMSRRFVQVRARARARDTTEDSQGATPAAGEEQTTESNATSATETTN